MFASVLSAAGQHRNFKKFNRPREMLLRILNFEKIENIFSLPVCALIALKGAATKWPVDSSMYEGVIDRHHRNARLSEVNLTHSSYKYSPPLLPEISEYSPYYKVAKVGASIYPRSFWFVEFVPHPTLRIIDASKPTVQSSQKAAEVGKKEWKDIKISGNVESEFIFATLLGKDLIPFGHLPFRPIVLPAKILADGHEIWSERELKAQGAASMAKWYQDVQKQWADQRTKKSEEGFPSAMDRVDYQKGLSGQDPSKRYIVLYNARGADSLTSVLDREQVYDFSVDHSKIKPVGFVADCTTFTYETKDEEEAHYLCAVLNSTLIHKQVKGFQPRGKYGKRDIGRRVFMLPIPSFSENNRNHRALAELSKKCHQVILDWSFTKKGFRGMRNEAAYVLRKEIEEIDRLAAVVVRIQREE